MRAWLGAPLSSELRHAFEAELAETNRRRLSVLFPLVMIGHGIHIWVFTWSPAARATPMRASLRWHDGIALAHLGTWCRWW